jgi:hypothetical protein
MKPVINFKEAFEKDMKKMKASSKDASLNHYYYKTLCKLSSYFGVNTIPIKKIFDRDDYNEEAVREYIIEEYGLIPLATLRVTKHESTIPKTFCEDFYKSRVFDEFRKAMDEDEWEFPHIVFKIKNMGDVVLCRDAGDTKFGKARILLPTRGTADNLVIMPLETFGLEYGGAQDEST